VRTSRAGSPLHRHACVMLGPSRQPVGDGHIAYTEEEVPALLDRIADPHLHRCLPPCRESPQEELVVAAQMQRPLRAQAGKETGEKRPDGTKLRKPLDTPPATPREGPRIRIDELLPERHGLVVAALRPRTRRGEMRLDGILGLIMHGVTARER